jgi:proteasome assembly chaperone 2
MLAYINRAGLSTPVYHLLPTTSTSLAESPLASLTSLPQYSSPENKAPSMPGGGLTRRILLSIPDGWAIRTGFLVWMGMEGDNRVDASLVASVVAKLLVGDGRIKGHTNNLICSLSRGLRPL